MICAFVWLQKSKEQFRTVQGSGLYILLRDITKLSKEKAKKEQSEGKTSKFASFQSLSHFRKAAGQLSGLTFGPLYYH